ncbi:MAG: outer membrane beta-barrel protein [Candidatus Solibacter sp.]
MKRICRFLPLLFCISFAYAQSAVDVNMGFGTFHDKASGSGIDSTTFASCTTGSTCLLTPSLSGFFMGFGGTIMLNKHLGFGAEASLQPSKQDYAGFQSRQIFYDFNGVYAPINEKKYMVRLEGGIGGATTSFSYSASSCVGTAVCQTQSQAVGSAKHFQVHFGAGVQLYVTEHLFIRPEFDLHYVPNFTNQFGSSIAPGAMVWIGYSMGDR